MAEYGIKVYSPDGSVILDNETQVLVLSGSVKAPCVRYSDYPNMTHNGWTATWELVRFTDAQTGATTGLGYITWQMIYPVSPPIFERMWFMPDSGSHAIISQNFFSASSQGTGVEVRYTSKQSPNKQEGFIDVYTATGELAWSANALMKSPIILATFMYEGGTSNLAINLAQYGVPVAEIFVSTTYVGEWTDEEAGTVRCVCVKRVNSMLYVNFTNNTGVKLYPAHILLARIQPI